MKYCSNCGVTLEDGVNFCSACGTAQTPVAPIIQTNNPAALTTLCVLTILGSVLGIIRGLFYESIASLASLGSGEFYMFGYLSIIANAGTLAGAILMLQRKMSGYILYIISQIVSIIVILVRTATFRDTGYLNDSMFNTFTFFLGAAFIVPSVVFIILYTTLVKKYLDK